MGLTQYDKTYYTFDTYNIPWEISLNIPRGYSLDYSLDYQVPGAYILFNALSSEIRVRLAKIFNETLHRT